MSGVAPGFTPTREQIHTCNRLIKWPTCAGDRSQLRKRGLKAPLEKNLADRPFLTWKVGTGFGNFSENVDSSAQFGK